MRRAVIALAIMAASVLFIVLKHRRDCEKAAEAMCQEIKIIDPLCDERLFATCIDWSR